MTGCASPPFRATSAHACCGRRAGTPTALETVIVMADYGTPSQRLLDRSDAAIFAIASAGGLYGAAVGLRIFPRFLRDAVYRLIARSRYRIFGRFDACPIPDPGDPREVPGLRAR